MLRDVLRGKVNSDSSLSPPSEREEADKRSIFRDSRRRGGETYRYRRRRRPICNNSTRSKKRKVAALHRDVRVGRHLTDRVRHEPLADRNRSLQARKYVWVQGVSGCLFKCSISCFTHVFPRHPTQKVAAVAMAGNCDPVLPTSFEVLRYRWRPTCAPHLPACHIPFSLSQVNRGPQKI